MLALFSSFVRRLKQLRVRALRRCELCSVEYRPLKDQPFPFLCHDCTWAFRDILIPRPGNSNPDNLSDLIYGSLQSANERKPQPVESIQKSANNKSNNTRLGELLSELQDLRYCPICDTGHGPGHPHYERARL
jgi:hypothetical protein